MNYDELSEKEQEIWNYAYDEGHEEGYSIGWDEAAETIDSELDCESGYDEGYEAGFQEGAKAEQARIQSILQMMFESSLNMGHGNKAVQYKHAMDLLRPVHIDYSEEAYQRGLEADGF